MLTMRVNAKKYLNVRAEPNAESEVIDKLKRGDKVLVTEVRDGWAKLTKGYCMVKLLEIITYVLDVEEEEIELGETDEEPSDEASGLEGMSVADLRDLAKKSGIALTGNMRKADIIAAILDD